MALAALLFMYPPGGITEEQDETGMDCPMARITDNIYVIYGTFGLPYMNNHGFRNNPGIVLTSAGVMVFYPGGGAWEGDMVIR